MEAKTQNGSMKAQFVEEWGTTTRPVEVPVEDICEIRLNGYGQIVVILVTGAEFVVAYKSKPIRFQQF